MCPSHRVSSEQQPPNISIHIQGEIPLAAKERDK